MDISSGNLLHAYGKIQDFHWENSLISMVFVCNCYVANYQRGVKV